MEKDPRSNTLARRGKRFGGDGYINLDERLLLNSLQNSASTVATAGMSEYTPHPARAFFSVILGGTALLALARIGQSEGDPEFVRIMFGTNTAGILLSAIVAAASARSAFPVFPKIMLAHVAGAASLGYLSETEKGLGIALGSALPISTICAGLAWLMLSRRWLVGDILLWGLAGLFLIGLVSIL